MYHTYHIYIVYIYVRYILYIYIYDIYIYRIYLIYTIYIYIYYYLFIYIYIFKYHIYIYLSYTYIYHIYHICTYIYHIYIYIYIIYIYRRKFRSQTSDNMDRWKAEKGRGREKRKIRRKKSRRERVRRKQMQMREEVGKSRNTVFFHWFGAPEGRKVGSLKRRARSQLARWEMKNCTPLWREAHLQVKMYKTPRSRSTFGSWDVEKVHAVVARSTFPSRNVQNTPCTDHFWKLRCRKSARRCGAKHISKSKCTKHTMYGPLLEVQMSFRVAGARDCGPCQKWAERECFVAFSTTTTTTLHSQTLHYTTTTTTPSLHSTTLHSTTLHCTQLHLITLHSTTLHSTTLHYTTPHDTTLHYTTLPATTLHYITLHYTTLHNTTTTTAHSISRNDGRRGAFE